MIQDRSIIMVVLGEPLEDIFPVCQSLVSVVIWMFLEHRKAGYSSRCGWLCYFILWYVRVKNWNIQNF